MKLMTIINNKKRSRRKEIKLKTFDGELLNVSQEFSIILIIPGISKSRHHQPQRQMEVQK